MSDALKDVLHEPLRRAFEAGREFERTLALRPTMFAADIGDGPHFPAAYTPDDIAQLDHYFGANEHGYYPGHFHRMFGLSARQFAERAGMVRVFAAADGKAGWAWKRRAFAAPGPPPRPGLVWNDATHRWRNPH